MAKSLIGCDVLPAAAHLTASMLAGAHPTTKYMQSLIMTVAYGRQPDDSVALGSLDLLDPQGKLGILAVIALTVYAILILAIFKLIPVTLTLAGIAGFILSVGMAVDANVLIFERMKEEKKAGRDKISAINEGFKRAWPSIRDGNVSTIITAIILYWFGTSIIKGFALTLLIGILISMFTAMILTRHLLKLINVHR